MRNLTFLDLNLENNYINNFGFKVLLDSLEVFEN